MNKEQLTSPAGIVFHDPTLLRRALTHRSYLNENPAYKLEDNERLEFLGDAILDFVVGEYLYRRFPHEKEGELTSLRSALVRTEMLADFARRIDLGRYLYMGKGEDETGGRQRLAILCGAFEAFVGAIYMDHDLSAVQDFITPFVDSEIDNIVNTDRHHDAKSRFQEQAQGFHKITPMYHTIGEEGPDHDKTFIVAVYLENVEYGRGKGPNKQHAEQNAAEAAIKKLSVEMKDAQL